MVKYEPPKQAKPRLLIFTGLQPSRWYHPRFKCTTDQIGWSDRLWIWFWMNRSDRLCF